MRIANIDYNAHEGLWYTAKAASDQPAEPFLQRLRRGTGAFLDIVGGISQWLGPGEPILPVAPQDVNVRRLDYPPGYDYTIAPRAYEPVDPRQLRGLADGYDLLRMAIEKRKRGTYKKPWQIRAKQLPGMSSKDMHEKTLSDKRIPALTEFWRYPDKEHDLRHWINALLEDMFVLDGVAVLPRWTRGGDIYAFDVIDGGIISRKLDVNGRTPVPPQVAYQQIIHGVVSRDLCAPIPKRPDLDQIYYHIRNFRANRIYGYGEVERIIMTVQIGIRRQLTQLEFYSEGGRPDTFGALPKEWTSTPTQLADFQAYWDSLFQGQNTGERRKMKFVPEGTKVDFSPHMILKDEYDEWLGRLICWVFDLPPDALIRQTYKGSQEKSGQDREEEGSEAVDIEVQGIINFLLRTYFASPDLEFEFGEPEITDAEKAARVQDVKIRNGTLTIDEGRSEDGRDPRGLDASVFLTAQGPRKVEALLTAPVAGGGGAFGGGAPAAGEKVIDAEIVPFALLAKKYDPDQPREPSGTPEGGEWTSPNAWTPSADHANEWRKAQGGKVYGSSADRVRVEHAGIIRETDKAVLARVAYDGPAGKGKADIWFPKSQIGNPEKGKIEAPDWLLRKKAEELAGGLAPTIRYGKNGEVSLEGRYADGHLFHHGEYTEGLYDPAEPEPDYEHDIRREINYIRSGREKRNYGG
jgi:hypothetical protein